jgi:hypothetical protein
MKKLFLLLLLVSLNSLYSEEYRHFPRIFVGGQTDMLEKHTLPTVGIEYMFAFIDSSPEIGVGLMAETAFGDNSEYSGALSLNVHLTNKWRAWLAPGLRIIQYPVLDSTKIDYTNKINNDHTGNKFNALMRFGTSYTFQFNDIFVEPNASIDIVNRHFSLIYGISFGLNF